MLLSLFFSGEAGGFGAKLLLFGLFVLAVGVALFGAEQSMRISATLLRLQDTTAEIRIRGSFLLLALCVVLAERVGLEAILGAFLAAAILKLVDRDQMLMHPQFRQKLEAVGYGVSCLCSSSRPRSGLSQTRSSGARPLLRACRSFSQPCSSCAGCRRFLRGAEQRAELLQPAR